MPVGTGHSHWQVQVLPHWQQAQARPGRKSRLGTIMATTTMGRGTVTRVKRAGLGPLGAQVAGNEIAPGPLPVALANLKAGI
jgi:hypothetical protein